jgi:hypothetical protein
VIWVLVFAAVGVVGLVVAVSYAVWLAHKAADVLAELSVLGQRGGQLLGLLEEIRVPDLTPGDWSHDSSGTVEATVARVSTT